jgi:hypothetical protein
MRKGVCGGEDGGGWVVEEHIRRTEAGERGDGMCGVTWVWKYKQSIIRQQRRIEISKTGSKPICCV